MYDAGILDTLTDEITHTDSKFPFKKCTCSQMCAKKEIKSVVIASASLRSA